MTTQAADLRHPAKSGPLTGLRVIDITINVLGPLATQILGDMGADVIKVETQDGDYTRNVGPTRSPLMGSLFLSLNRNKRAMILDLKRAHDHDAMMRLIDTADVFVHSMRHRAAERLGLGYQAVAARKPDIVYASATGFRKNSPMKDRPAFDDVIQGMSGIAALNSRNGEPSYLPMVIADKFVGHSLASAIAFALLHRERTGEGQEVHVPMYETMTAFNLIEHLWGGALGEPEKGLGYGRMLTPHRRPYATKDGYIVAMANTDEQYRRLFGVIDRPELADDPRFTFTRERVKNIDTLYGIIREAMLKRTTKEWQALLDAADIPNGPLNQLKDVWSDPQLRETNFFQSMDHPSEGQIVLMANPMDLSRSPSTIRLPPPRLGEHTAAILEELGLA